MLRQESTQRRRPLALRPSASLRGALRCSVKPAATRNSTSGFAVSSQDEWIKAAYFDPKGGGKHSYWDYPTNPGLYVNCAVDVSGCASGQQPNQATLDANGNVTFTFLVDNTGQEDVTLTSLTDSVFGDLDGLGTCSVPRAIPIGGSYSCTYTVFLSFSFRSDIRIKSFFKF